MALCDHYGAAVCKCRLAECAFTASLLNTRIVHPRNSCALVVDNKMHQSAFTLWRPDTHNTYCLQIAGDMMFVSGLLQWNDKLRLGCRPQDIWLGVAEDAPPSALHRPLSRGSTW